MNPYGKTKVQKRKKCTNKSQCKIGNIKSIFVLKKIFVHLQERKALTLKSIFSLPCFFRSSIFRETTRSKLS